MDNLLNFYNSLLGIEIAVFSVISAVILVFVQLVYSKYSYKYISHILRDLYLILFFFFSVGDLILTSIGSYSISIGKHDFFPNHYFGIHELIQNQYYALVCLILIFISICFFIILIVKNINFLKPNKAIFLLSKDMNYKNIRNFIWKAYDIEEPITRMKIIEPDNNIEQEENTIGLNISNVDDEEMIREAEKKVASIKRKMRNAEDPLIPLRDMMIQFIKQTDLSSLSEASSLLKTISVSFVEKYYLSDKDTEWSPDSSLLPGFTQHLLDILLTLLEIGKKEGLDSARIIILDISYDYSLALCKFDQFSELFRVFQFWEGIADSSIGSSPQIFRLVISYYNDIGYLFFSSIENLSRDNREILNAIDEVFRNLGWLCERVLLKVPIEAPPSMRNYHNYSEFIDLFECLMSFGSKYEDELPYLYPLIYFDALDVVFIRLVDKEGLKRTFLSEKILDIAFFLSTFAKNAIKVNNGHGAALAAIRIKQMYDYLKRAGVDKIASDVIKQLVGIGFFAAGYKDSLKVVDFFHMPLDEKIIEMLATTKEDISDEVFNNFVKIDEFNLDVSRLFVKALENKMNRKFAFLDDRQQ